MTIASHANLRIIRFMRFWFVFSLFFPTLCFASSQPEIENFTLDNGLQVIVIEDHRIPAISHNLLFRFGAADDPQGKSGLAHYMEHMLFQGTKTVKPNEYSHRIAAKGGRTNAFTSADYTGYWVNITKDELPLVMELEADRWQYLSPTPDDFEREKQVILEERRMRVDNNPMALFREQFNATLFLHYPYRIPIIGWADEMKRLSRQDVLDYYTNYHHPGNAVLVIAGDIETEEVKKLATRYYGSIPARGESVPPRVAEPPHLAPRRIEMHHAQVKQASWRRSFMTPSYGWNAEKNKQHFIALMIADYLLGGSRTARLYQTLVEEQQLAQHVNSSFNPFTRGPGSFTFSATPTDETNLPEIERLIAEELRKLRQHPPREEELQRAKTQLIAGNIYLQDGLQPLARVIGLLSILDLPLDYYFNWEEQVQAVTAQQVSDSLSLLDEKASVTGTLLPEPMID